MLQLVCLPLKRLTIFWVAKLTRKTECAAAMEAGKQTGSTKILLDSTRPKKHCTLSEKLHEQSRAKTRVILGVAFERWRQL